MPGLHLYDGTVHEETGPPRRQRRGRQSHGARLAQRIVELAHSDGCAHLVQRDVHLAEAEPVDFAGLTTHAVGQLAGGGDVLFDCVCVPGSGGHG